MAKDIKPDIEQITTLFNETVLQYHLYSEPNPKVLIVAGVSGSGKSTLITKLLERNSMNFFPVQADDYRKMHPKIKQLREKYGFDEAHKKTGNFAHRFATDLLNTATEKRFNILYETTFGNLETANKLLNFFKACNYKVYIFALPANVELSILRNKKRYQEKILARSSLPRIVEKTVIERMAENYVCCIEQLKNDEQLSLFEIEEANQAQFILREILDI